MAEEFNINPILNSPYEEPRKHWHLDSNGLPTGISLDGRRPSIHLVPIPKAKQQRRKDAAQPELELEHEVNENPIINRIRQLVKEWRMKPEGKWDVTYVTERLLKYWREGNTNPRPFFCQVEAAETLIWLNEVAPNTKGGKEIIQQIEDANKDANPKLVRFANKMATGSGKTTVMAMMIAYHTLNKVRQPNSNRFTNSFLIITPGITIKDRLRVLLPADPENYYAKNEIVPPEFRQDIARAQVVITNYHTFKHRETVKMSKGAKDILKGNSPDDISTVETSGQMLARACKELLSAKSVVVMNDEAHHCYRHRVEDKPERLTGDDREEAKKNNEAARLWISGIEALSEKVKLKNVYDLSATPFFLRGSGYSEGKLFSWVVSDFSLMDAIESGIVKLPRVPIDDGTVTTDNLPIYRNIYKHIDLPKMGRKKQGALNPEDIPPELEGALEALYENYRKTNESWEKAGISVPPVFIVVCNNCSTSKMVYDFISGYELPKHPGRWKKGALPLFSNIDENEKPVSQLRTLLIDSEQIDSGDALSGEFKEAATPEIEQFKKDRRIRQQGRDNGEITDEELLREVMNTIGKKGKLGEQIRCVVSVSMLTEGWDTNNVTHVLGVRAFGTQLLCEQVVGRALRRYDYQIGEDGKFAPEYADVFGVPFTFATGTKITKPKPPKPQHRVHAQDDRTHAAISFPRVKGYTVRIPDEKLVANFTENSRLVISPEDAPPNTLQESIVGEGEMMSLAHLKEHRMNRVVFHLAGETAKSFADDEDNIPPSRFRDLIPITRRWISDYLTCTGGTFEQYLLLKEFAVKAAERIYLACAPGESGEESIIPVIDKFTPEGSSYFVDFMTSRTRLFDTGPDKCHVNLAVCDSDWEMDFCQFLDSEPAVQRWIRNDGLGLEIPYIYTKEARIYIPDFIILIDDGHGADDLLNLVVEIKGFKDGAARAKADTAERQWVPAVNNDGRWGRWAFTEISDMREARERINFFASGQPITARTS